MNEIDIAKAASECIATRVRHLSRIITRVYDESLRPLGITSSQYILLAQIAAHDGISCVDITNSLDVDKSTLSRNFSRLIKMQFVTMGRHRGRYPRELGLTNAGKHLLNEAFPLWQDAQRRSLETMGQESLSLLDLLLEKANAISPVVVLAKRKVRA